MLKPTSYTITTDGEFYVFTLQFRFNDLHSVARTTDLNRLRTFVWAARLGGVYRA